MTLQAPDACARHAQGPSQPGSPAGREAAGNGAHAANPFATPNSAASHASFEDEETLLLDPQARFHCLVTCGCVLHSLGCARPGRTMAVCARTTKASAAPNRTATMRSRWKDAAHAGPEACSRSMHHEQG